MKKIFLSILFFCTMLYVHAGTYYASGNQINKLLDAVEDHKAGDPLRSSTGRANTDIDAGWDKLTGLTWTDPAEPLEYRGSEYKYYRIKAIDYSNKGFVQLPDVDIALEQYANTLGASSDAEKQEAEDNELRWLQSVNFSGNQFHSVIVDGAGLLDQLTVIDLSNNPALKKLTVKGCPNPNLKIIISENGFSLGQIFDLMEFVLSGKVVYANQGYVRRAFAPGAVDLRDEYTFPTGKTTYEFTNENGGAVTPATSDGKGFFTFSESYAGKKLYCKLKNVYFPDFGEEGLVYLITLTSDLTALDYVDITPKAPTTYVGSPVQLKASAYNFAKDVAEGVTVRWESANGTFDDATSFTPNFTPSQSGTIQLKCIATQKRTGKDDVVAEDVVSFEVNPARIVTYIDVQFKLGVYLTNEEATFTMSVTDQYGVHKDMTDGIQFLTSMGSIDPAGKTFICPNAGYPSITFKAGSYEKTIDLIIIEDEPLDAWYAEASSEKGETVDDFGGINRNFAEDVIDSNRSTRWCASQYPDGSGNGTLNGNNKDIPEYIIIDLNEVADICMIEIDWEVSRAAIWELSVSEDGDKWESFGSDEPVDMGGNHYISRILGQAKARYIKLDCFERTSDQWKYSVWEIVAYAGQLPSSTKKIVSQSLAFYNGEQLIIKNETKVSTVIYSVTGQKVLSSNASVINVSSLNKGIYVARMINEDGKVSTFKFIK